MAIPLGARRRVNTPSRTSYSFRSRSFSSRSIPFELISLLLFFSYYPFHPFLCVVIPHSLIPVLRIPLSPIFLLLVVLSRVPFHPLHSYLFLSYSFIPCLLVPLLLFLLSYSPLSHSLFLLPWHSFLKCDRCSRMAWVIDQSYSWVSFGADRVLTSSHDFAGDTTAARVFSLCLSFSFLFSLFFCITISHLSLSPTPLRTIEILYSEYQCKQFSSFSLFSLCI